jgi:uncharacterized cupin superfamily protein
VAGYAIRNLKRDVEDQSVKFGLSPDMEARFARDDLGCTETGLSYQRLAPSVRQPFAHRHESQEEVYVVVGGSGRIALGDDVVEVERWDAVRVSSEVVRAFEAGPDGLEILAFGGRETNDAETQPPSWPE